MKSLNPADPGLNGPGRWTLETALTRFQVVQGPVYETLFEEMQVIVNAFNRRGIEGMNFPLEVEPHLAHSDRSFGLTEPWQFQAAVAGVVHLATRYGVSLDNRTPILTPIQPA